ncbi:MAG: U32 family peptidase [Bacillota bacterium]|nr:U32 family peptidase [Bacillota bacterium]
MQNDPIEILSPAGSFEAVFAAVKNGTDAVYFGAPAFSARAYAKNLSIDEFFAACSYCKENNVKVHITLNTLLTDRELKGALEVADAAKQADAAAIIVQDLGLAKLIKQNFPTIALHGSTQMSIHSLDGAKELSEMGFSRVVLARELPSAMIEYITKNAGIETEVFGHGALCYSYSGQCLMSAVIGQRSGNRGRCAQPCRLPYCVDGKKDYIMSLKDLCLVNIMQDLKRMGVASVKIEGRMKRPEYVSASTRIYHKAVIGEQISKQDIRNLEILFSRSGFTQSYFEDKKGKQMLGIKADNENSEYNSILKSERSTYEKDFNNYKIETKRSFMPSLININFPVRKKILNRPILNCFFQTAEQAKKSVRLADALYLSANEIIKIADEFDSGKLGVIFPKIIFDNELKKYAELLQKVNSLGIRSAYLENLGQFELAKKSGFTILTGLGLNCYNSLSIELLYSLGAGNVTISCENSFPQIRDMNASVPVGIFAYGRLPLMTTENCVMRNTSRCEGKGTCQLPSQIIDRRGERFPVFSLANCRNVIYNSKKIYLADKLNGLKKLPLSFYNLHFTDESGNTCAEIIAAYKGGSDRRPTDFTRGLYNKGVE